MVVFTHFRDKWFSADGTDLWVPGAEDLGILRVWVLMASMACGLCTAFGGLGSGESQHCVVAVLLWARARNIHQEAWNSL